MSTGVRVPYLRGLELAEKFSDDIRDVTDRIEIAGSLRRHTETVGDVELVVIPKMTEEEVPDGLWGTTKLTTNLLLERLTNLLHSGRWLPDPDDPKAGERYAKFLNSEGEDEEGRPVQVDLFMVLPPAQFGVIHLIRTGSDKYSQWFVTAVRSKGFHVKDGALHRGGIGCGKYVCEVVPTPAERDVYEVTGLPPQPPHLR